MALRIVCDSSSWQETKILNDQGEDITRSLGVREIDINICVDEINTAVLHCVGVKVDVVAEEDKAAPGWFDQLCFNVRDAFQFLFRRAEP